MSEISVDLPPSLNTSASDFEKVILIADVVLGDRIATSADTE